MAEEFPYFNDIARKKCKIIDYKRREELIDQGVTPIGYWVIIENEDGTHDQLYPWEITMIHKEEWEKL